MLIVAIKFRLTPDKVEAFARMAEALTDPTLADGRGMIRAVAKKEQ